MGAVTRIVALDYGERRVGVASADSELRMALSHATVEARSADEMLSKVASICRELEADRVVVGKPINMDGSIGPSAKHAEAFATALGNMLGIKVELWDERLSTVVAERALLEADVSRQNRKRVRDKLAAQVILQSFLDGEAMTDDGEPTGR